ncbi:MAG TPA: hypothetical protein VKD19_14570 [Pseudolabrys sp.]|jgi:hypothetical protein|nr:hypothetical protein [Pseudolabrys sp.]
MAGPTKTYDPKKLGHQVQTNYDFLDELFGTNQKAFRNKFFNCKTETALRRMLDKEGVKVKRGVRIMLVDVENARTKSFGRINPRRDDFYLLLMPPVPRRKKSKDYKEDQSWEGAWHHAIVDGYGM